MEKINQIQVLPSGLLGTISREIGWGQTVKKVNGGGGGDLLCMQCLYGSLQDHRSFFLACMTF